MNGLMFEEMLHRKIQPPLLRLRAALRNDAAAARAFHLASEGMIDPERFFDVENLRALVGTEVPASLLERYAATEVNRVKRAAV